ncbi:basic proline-rich protein-like [Sorex araneus]|uniref:basic proline-rich protein-like n=1 Tax=Sorex araneus TaxID=42254 RepID=UPI002433BD86|nr:basic proline-rich protein-like [Sorex araneus]
MLALDILESSLAPLESVHGEVTAAATLAGRFPQALPQRLLRVGPGCGTRRSLADPFPPRTQAPSHSQTCMHTRLVPAHLSKVRVFVACAVVPPRPEPPGLGAESAVEDREDGARLHTGRDGPVCGGRPECGASRRSRFKCGQPSAAPGAAPLHWPDAAAGARARYPPPFPVLPPPPPPTPPASPRGPLSAGLASLSAPPRPGRLGEVTPGNRAWNAQQITFSAPVGGGSARGNPPGSRPLIPPPPRAWAFPLAGSVSPASARRCSGSRRGPREGPAPRQWDRGPILDESFPRPGEREFGTLRLNGRPCSSAAPPEAPNFEGV